MDSNITVQVIYGEKQNYYTLNGKVLLLETGREIQILENGKWIKIIYDWTNDISPLIKIHIPSIEILNSIISKTGFETSDKFIVYLNDTKNFFNLIKTTLAIKELEGIKYLDKYLIINKDLLLKIVYEK